MLGWVAIDQTVEETDSRNRRESGMLAGRGHNHSHRKNVLGRDGGAIAAAIGVIWRVAFTRFT